MNAFGHGFFSPNRVHLKWCDWISSTAGKRNLDPSRSNLNMPKATTLCMMSVFLRRFPGAMKHIQNSPSRTNGEWPSHPHDQKSSICAVQLVVLQCDCWAWKQGRKSRSAVGQWRTGKIMERRHFPLDLAMIKPKAQDTSWFLCRIHSCFTLWSIALHNDFTKCRLAVIWYIWYCFNWYKSKYVSRSMFVPRRDFQNVFICVLWRGTNVHGGSQQPWWGWLKNKLVVHKFSDEPADMSH